MIEFNLLKFWFSLFTLTLLSLFISNLQLKQPEGLETETELRPKQGRNNCKLSLALVLEEAEMESISVLPPQTLFGLCLILVFSLSFSDHTL